MTIPKDEQAWIKEDLDRKIKEGYDMEEVAYKLQLFLSTDGKHTVHVETDVMANKEERKKAIADAMKLYNFVKGMYGTKADMWEGKIGKQPAQATIQPQKVCSLCGSPMEYKEGFSKKTNKPWSGWFCTSVKEHVEWDK